MAFAALIIASGTTAAQSSPTCVTGLEVNGQGTVQVTPDVGIVSLSVKVTKPTQLEAQQQAAQVTDSVVTAVSAVPGINGTRDVTTNSLSSYQDYSYSTNGTKVSNGYAFTNYITVEIQNVTAAAVSNVTDAATKAGGNAVSIGSFSTDLSPSLKKSSMTQAQQQAVQSAQGSATVLASSAGVKLGAVLSLVSSDTAPNTATYTPTAAAAAVPSAPGTPGAPGAPGTPVNIGTTQVSAYVTMIYAMS